MYHLFYYPDREEYDTPHRAGLAYEQVYFDSADGTRLSGWFIPAQDVASPQAAKGTVIHLHGNAQNMTAHWSFAEFVPSRGYNLFTFDYRGFGESQGSPEPQGIFEDSVAALDYLRSRTDIDTGKLFVFGQSLGGMLAIAAAGASPRGVRAVLAEAPFHSYTAMVQDKMPQANLTLRDDYTATAYVAKLSPVPLLLIHGTADVVVPYSHSVRLLAEAGEPKRLVQIPGGDHVDAMVGQVHGRKYQDMMMALFDAEAGKPADAGIA